MTAMHHAGLARGLPPHANVSEFPDEYVVELELSDFAEPELTVELDGNRLTVRGEQFETDDEAAEPFRLRERLVESFTLPADVEPAGVVAFFERGLLEIHAPRGHEQVRRVELRRKEHGLLHDAAEPV